MQDIFVLSNCNGPELRSKGFNKPNIQSVNFGENSLKYLGSKIWDLIPMDMKNVSTLEQFKALIKKWEPKSCPCRLCKTYVQGLGFVNIT